MAESTAVKAPAKKAAANRVPAKKVPAKVPAAKSILKRVQSKHAAADLASRKAKGSKAAKTRKERLHDDRPVTRSGLSSVSHDELNPGFALKTH